MKQRTIKNHYEPQLKLKGFGKVNDSGNAILTVYNKEKDEFIFNRSTKSIGYEKNLYRTIDKININRIEDNFSKIENLYKNSILDQNKLDEYINLPNLLAKDVDSFSLYAMTTLFRTPTVSSNFIKTIESYIKHTRVSIDYKKELIRSLKDVYYDSATELSSKKLAESFVNAGSSYMIGSFSDLDSRLFDSDHPVIQFKDGQALYGGRIYDIDAIFTSIDRKRFFALWHKNKEFIYKDLFKSPDFINKSYIRTCNNQIFLHPDDVLYAKKLIQELKYENNMYAIQSNHQPATIEYYGGLKHHKDYKNGIYNIPHSLIPDFSFTQIFKNSNGVYVYNEKEALNLCCSFGSTTIAVDFMLEVSSIEDVHLKEHFLKNLNLKFEKLNEIKSLLKSYRKTCS